MNAALRVIMNFSVCDVYDCRVASPPVGMRSIVISVSVCLFVCLLAYLKNHTIEFHQVFCLCGRGSVLFWRQCDMLCTSSFMDDVMFPNNGGNIRYTQYAYDLPGDLPGAPHLFCRTSDAI